MFGNDFEDSPKLHLWSQLMAPREFSILATCRAMFLIAGTCSLKCSYGADGIFVEGASLAGRAEPIPRVVESSADAASVSFRLVFASHFVKAGSGIVLIIRQDLPRENVDRRGFRKLSLQLPKFDSSFEASLEDPRVGVRYSFGNSIWALDRLGFALVRGSGTVLAKRVDENSVHFEMSALFHSNFAARPPMISKEIKPMKCSAKGILKRVDLARLTPWFGMPIEQSNWQEAVRRSDAEESGRVELKCEELDVPKA
jgi:hypothetical protein